jgi:calcium-dependent protein kinase
LFDEITNRSQFSE